MKLSNKIILLSFFIVVFVYIFVPYPKKIECISPRVSTENKPIPCDIKSYVSYSYFDYLLFNMGLPSRLSPEKVSNPQP
jgi:hypothetical protein